MRAGGVQGRVALRGPSPGAARGGRHGGTRTAAPARRPPVVALPRRRARRLPARPRDLLQASRPVEPATEVAWLKVVVKHEAMAIRRSRQDSVAGEEPDLDSHIPAGQRSVDEQIESGERVGRSAEALRALKPDEAKALLLKAEGLSYLEIGEHCGWSYTKVNRALTEGRKRFLKAYRAIEAGDECERFAPVLLQLAAGRGEQRPARRGPAAPAPLHRVPRDRPRPPHVRTAPDAHLRPGRAARAGAVAPGSSRRERASRRDPVGRGAHPRERDDRRPSGRRAARTPRDRPRRPTRARAPGARFAAPTRSREGRGDRAPPPLQLLRRRRGDPHRFEQRRRPPRAPSRP